MYSVSIRGVQEQAYSSFSNIHRRRRIPNGYAIIHLEVQSLKPLSCFVSRKTYDCSRALCAVRRLTRQPHRGDAIYAVGCACDIVLGCVLRVLRLSDIGWIRASSPLSSSMFSPPILLSEFEASNIRPLSSVLRCSTITTVSRPGNATFLLPRA